MVDGEVVSGCSEGCGALDSLDSMADEAEGVANTDDAIANAAAATSGDADPYADVPRYEPAASMAVAPSPFAVSNSNMKKATIAHKFLDGWYGGDIQKESC